MYTIMGWYFELLIDECFLPILLFTPVTFPHMGQETGPPVLPGRLSGWSQITKAVNSLFFNFKNYNPGVRLRDQRKKMQSPQLSLISSPHSTTDMRTYDTSYMLCYNICYMFLSYIKKYSKRKIPMTTATGTKIIKKLTSEEMYRINLQKVIGEITTEVRRINVER